MWIELIIADFQEVSLSNYETLLQEVRELKSLVHRVLKSSPTSPELAGVEWPLKTLQDYDQAQQLLLDKTEFTKEVRSYKCKTYGSYEKRLMHCWDIIRLPYCPNSGDHQGPK
jgi:hypothetical protein